jgi:hypothetical protein
MSKMYTSATKIKGEPQHPLPVLYRRTRAHLNRCSFQNALMVLSEQCRPHIKCRCVSHDVAVCTLNPLLPSLAPGCT